MITAGQLTLLYCESSCTCTEEVRTVATCGPYLEPQALTTTATTITHIIIYLPIQPPAEKPAYFPIPSPPPGPLTRQRNRKSLFSFLYFLLFSLREKGSAVSRPAASAPAPPLDESPPRPVLSSDRSVCRLLYLGRTSYGYGIRILRSWIVHTSPALLLRIGRMRPFVGTPGGVCIGLSLNKPCQTG